MNVERRIGEKSAGKKFKDCVAWSLREDGKNTNKLVSARWRALRANDDASHRCGRKGRTEKV